MKQSLDIPLILMAAFGVAAGLGALQRQQPAPTPTPAVEPWPSILVDPAREEVVPTQEPEPTTSNAEPLVDADALRKAIDAAAEAPMMYRSWSAGCQAAAETGQPLVLVVSQEEPVGRDALPSGVVLVWAEPDAQDESGATHRELFAGWTLPLALLVPKVVWGATPEKFVPLDLSNLSESVRKKL